MEQITFGDRMKALRLERDLLQSEFGEMLGDRLGTKRISPSAIGSYERNEREPSLTLLREIADFFCVSLDYLLCRTDERLTVDEYIKRDSIELQDALATLRLTHGGELISPEERQRIYDISFALLWRS